MAGIDSNTKLLLRPSSLPDVYPPADGSGIIIDAAGRHLPTKYGSCDVYANPRHPLDSSTRVGYHDGTNYFYMADSADWDLFSTTTNSATIECWVICLDSETTDNLSIFTTFGNYYNGMTLYLDGQGPAGPKLQWLNYKTAGQYDLAASASGIIKSHKWHWCVGIKSGTDIGVYIDGQQAGYASQAYTGTSSNTALFGYNRNSTGTTSSIPPYYICDIRISDTNRYSGSPVVGLTDTITVPTSKATSDANTVMLVKYDGDKPVDTESHGITFVGNRVGVSTGYYGDGGIFFDGNSDYIVVPDSSDFTFTGDLTCEMWVNTSNTASQNTILGSYTSGDTYFHAMVRVSATTGYALGQISDGTSLYATVVGTTNIADGTWHHIALVRNGARTDLYVDGTSEANDTSSSGTVNFNTDGFTIGRHSPSTATNYFNGYLDEVRISNTARYTTGFTVPTTYHTPDSNTKLLIQGHTQDQSYLGDQ